MLATTVYRGVKNSAGTSLQRGQSVTWWQFSSCTEEMAMLEQPQFLGPTGHRTFFMINTREGTALNLRTPGQSLSFAPEQKEVLLNLHQSPVTFLVA